MNQIDNLSKLCVHTITTKPWSIHECIENYAENGVKGITVWRQALENQDVKQIGNKIRDNGLSIVSLCRGGFFPAKDKKVLQDAIDENRRVIDEAVLIGAPLIVLVCGAVPGQSLDESRKQIGNGIQAILPYASQANVKLAIEPLHPMYADSRSAINTMEQANTMCEQINSPYVGVAVDVYHLWWDSNLKKEIIRCGRNNKIFAFHICDWLTPTVDLLNDRGLMGEGCIPIREIREWVEENGFDGFHEVEIFSDRWWKKDQKIFLKEIREAYYKI